MDEATLALVENLLARQGAALELYARQWCETPEDVVQEAVLRLARTRPLPERPVAWLYRTVRNGAISSARATARRRRHEAAAARAIDWFEASTHDQLDARQAAEALRELPVEQREVLVARLWGGLNFSQIAEVAGCSSSAAHRRYVAALAALRERLGVPCPMPTASPNG